MRKVGLEIDQGKDVVSLPHGRKFSTAENLAMNFRTTHPSKFAKKANLQPSEKISARTTTQEKTFAQAIRREEGELFQILGDPSLDLEASQLRLPVNALIFELVRMYGERTLLEFGHACNKSRKDSVQM